VLVEGPEEKKLYLSLFERAFGKEATVTEIRCVAIGDDHDEFEVRLAG